MSVRMRHVALVVTVALAGVVLAVVLAILTSHLTAQHVGLAGEPLKPKSGLVSRPPARTAPARTDDGEVERGDD